jgi:outer membrane protein TolC
MTRRGIAALLLALGIGGGWTKAGAQQQTSLTLGECYRLAEANYPLTRQRSLITKTRDYTIANLAKGVYPQLDVSGTATYQSAVTSIDIPPIAGIKINIPTVPKDQYKLYGEVSQTLTGFGINRQQRVVSGMDAAVQEANLTTDLYQLRDRINQLFFGALLVDAQLEQNALTEQDIRIGIKNVQAAVNNGTDFVSSVNKLKAQLLTTQQRSIELRASKMAYTDMLSLFINEPVDTATVLVRPDPPSPADSINRPELRAYDLQDRSYTEQIKLTRLGLFPQLSAFFQGGMGQPNPVNLLSTQLSTYYYTGLRLSWTIGGSYTYKRDRLISGNNREMVQAQRSTFLFNTSLTMRQESEDIQKYRQLVKSDEEIVQLRESVDKTSAVQLQNGVITVNDYLQDVNAAALARQDRAVHEIQLLSSQYDHKTTSGN